MGSRSVGNLSNCPPPSPPVFKVSRILVPSRLNRALLSRRRRPCPWTKWTPRNLGCGLSRSVYLIPNTLDSYILRVRNSLVVIPRRIWDPLRCKLNHPCFDCVSDCLSFEPFYDQLRSKDLRGIMETSLFSSSSFLSLYKTAIIIN